MNTRIILGSVVLFLVTTTMPASSDLRTPKLATGVVTEGAALQTPKLSPGVVVEAAGLHTAKLAVGIVIELAPGGSRAALPPSPLTHW